MEPPTWLNSTPVKAADPPAAPHHEDGDEDGDGDGFSFLSPIYSDGSSSEGDPGPEPDAPPPPPPGGGGDPGLSPWELWLVGKAKEHRLHLHRTAKEENLLKERKGLEEMQREHQKVVMREKIQEWLMIKKEQEMQNQQARQRKEEEEIRKKREKEREKEEKAQQKYKDWLKKKNQEKIELEKKEKEKAALKEEQERERRKRAEEKFKEWLAKANEKGRDGPKTPCSSTNPFDRSNPSPSYFNPIPWKPIHIPPPEKPKEETCGRRPRRLQRSKQSQSPAFRLRASASPGQLHWR